MTSVGQVASAEIVPASVPAAGSEIGGSAPTGAASPQARLISFGAIGLALLSALATFLVGANLTPVVPTHTVNLTLYVTDGIAAVLLILTSAGEVWRIVQARRRGRAAARLHVRTLLLFCLVAAAPAIVVAFVSIVTFNRALDRMFSQEMKSLVRNSVTVADAYVNDHVQLLNADSITLAIALADYRPLFDQDREKFRQFLTAQANIRGLAAVVLIDGDLNIVEQSKRDIGHTFVMPSRDVLKGTNENVPQNAFFLDANYIAAILKLQAYNNTYLYIARLLNHDVVNQVRVTNAGLEHYELLEAQRVNFGIAFALMYALIALIFLLLAFRIGLNFANYLVAPIRRLIDAAQMVSTGNLFVKVPVQRSEGDLAHLGETFNKMTQELRTQHEDIVRARDQIDSRRRFTEAVLSGASAGVIGVDSENRISILNRSAERLIGKSQAQALGRPVAEVAPELNELLAGARTGMQRLAQGLVTINRDGRERNVSVRVTEEQSGEAERGYVITLDDITELVAAQRNSAWADVARRIAHEIKNPLTPIQLSAERLRRKYGSVVKDDEGIFRQCTDTIVRQVDDIKRMVDEFSRFARMPKPVMSADDVSDAVRQVVFLLRVGHPDIDIEVEFAEDPMPARFDRRLISQALTNIIKNATEAIAAVPAAELGRGHIRVSAARDGGDVVIDVVDNGIGLPKENRSRLLEPYVTTREKGTGLGLAIVGRILEDHGGLIELGDAATRIPGQRGAWMRLRFAAEPVSGAASEEPKNRQVATSA
jgi:two-component system, NtrC family, nitrogen regulation sensor histidine kinase NtrY